MNTRFCALLVAASAALSVRAAGQGTSTLIDFEHFPCGEAVSYTSADISYQWRPLGVIISDSSPQDGASAYASTGGLIPPHSGSRGIGPSEVTGGGYLLVSFVDPNSTSPGVVNDASIWVQNYTVPPVFYLPSTVTFYGPDGSSLQSVTTTGSDFLASLHSESGIASIRISDPDYFTADDLQFGPVTAVPEPGTWALVALGTAAIALLRRQYGSSVFRL